MIYYSSQNPIDLCAVDWTFDDTDGRFYNWKNQPADNLVSIPPRRVRNQIYILDTEATSIDVIVRVINAKTGIEIPGVTFIYSLPSTLTGMLYEFIVDASLLPVNTKFYVELDVIYSLVTTDSFRSSCFSIESNELKKLIRIDYGNTVNNRQINGILFFESTFFHRYMYLDKYDTEIEIVDDEESSDFEGNKVLVDKTHQEIDVYDIISMPKKFFMGLVKISENDLIYVNGRKANIRLEKVTESKIGAFEIPYINAFMRVTYADDNGLLDTTPLKDDSFLLINDTDYLLINELNKLKIR